MTSDPSLHTNAWPRAAWPVFRAAASCVALPLLLAGCHPRPEVDVHVWSADEVRQELLLQLQRIGNLSGYIVEVTPDRTAVLVLTPSAESLDQHACTTPQKPTVLKEPLEPEALHRASASFETVNQNLLEGQSTLFEGYKRRHQCDVHDGSGWKPLTVDEVRQLSLLQLQRVGELSRYIRSVDGQGKIHLWAYSPRDAACGAKLGPYPSERPVGKTELSLVEEALEAANAALAAGREPEVVSPSAPVPCGQ